MTSVLPPLAQAISGSIGAAAANVGSYPLDLAATRIQTSRGGKKSRSITGVLKSIVRKGGYGALFEGLKTDTGATVISNFFYFYFYTFLRNQYIKRRSKPKFAIAEELAMGFIAGVASRAISTPLSLVTVRLQSESDEEVEEKGEKTRSKRSVAGVFREIYVNDGSVGFWRGFRTSILLCTNPAITLLLFQLFRRLFLPSSNRNNPTPLQGFVGGAMSNAIAVLLLYPLMLAKTRIQHDSGNGRNSMVKVLKKAYYDDKTGGGGGVKGMYQGLEVQVMKGFVNQGLTMMIKQRVESLMILAYLRVLSKCNVS